MTGLLGFNARRTEHKFPTRLKTKHNILVLIFILVLIQFAIFAEFDSQAVKMQAAVISQHPYFPEDASIPDFVSNDKSLTDIVLPFAGTITCILAASAILSKRINPSLSLTDLGQVCWFVLSECQDYRISNSAIVGLLSS